MLAPFRRCPEHKALKGSIGDVSRLSATATLRDYNDGYVAYYLILTVDTQIFTPRTRFQFTGEGIRDASAGNHGQHPRAHTHRHPRPTDTGCMRFSGHLVDGTQPKASLLFGPDTQQKLPAMDGQCHPLWIENPPPQVRPLVGALALS